MHIPNLAKITIKEGSQVKTCKICHVDYTKSQIREIGLFQDGLFYANCGQCHSTITAKGQITNTGEIIARD